MILPWQTEQWARLLAATQANRLPHALLLSGIQGTGKRQFADALSQALLCQSAKVDGVSVCGRCHACKMAAGRVHPAIFWVEPEERGHAIKIDQIRAANEFVQQTALQGDRRVVIVNPADAMNRNAANALLKTLEEPASGALLLLVSSQRERLPATILSRCQLLHFPRPSLQVALQWMNDQAVTSMASALLLRLANGAPLAALALATDGSLAVRQNLYNGLAGLIQKKIDPIKLAFQFKEMPPLSFVDTMLSWLMDCLRVQLGGLPNEIVNHDFEAEIVRYAGLTQLADNVSHLTYLQQLRGQVVLGLNLNKQLLVENVLLRSGLV